MGRYKDEGEILMMSEEILQLNKKEFEKYFCDAYIKTIRPSEKSYYKKHLITWNKLMKLIREEKYIILKKSPACITLYNDFWRNLLDVRKEHKTPIEYLLLSTDVNNCLRRQKLIYINDLEVYAENFEQLIKIRKVGNKAANEITSRLNTFCINEKRKMDLQVLKENSDYNLLWENKAELIEIIIKKDS